MVHKYNTPTEAAQCRGSFFNHEVSVKITRMDTFRECVVAYCEEYDMKTGDTNVKVYGIGGNDLEKISLWYPPNMREFQ